MKIIKKFWPLIFIFCIAIFSILNSIYHGVEENKLTYNFRITKLDTTSTHSLDFYDGNKKIELWNFIVSTGQGVEVGDYLIKDKCAKILFIMRKNAHGKFIKINSFNNISYFSNLICD